MGTATARPSQPRCDWALASLQAAEQGPLRFVDADDKEEAELVVSTALLLARARQIVANGQVETAIAKDVHPSQLREAIALLNQARQRLESVYEDPSEADSDLEFFWLEVELWCINLELVRRQLSGSKAPSGALGAKRLELLRSQAKLVDEWAREQARAAGNIAQREAWAIRLHELPGMSAAQQRIAILAQRDPSILESPKTLQREMAVWLAPLAHLHDQALKDFFADEESAAGFKQHFISEVRRLEALSCSATVLSVFRRARRGGMEDPALVDQTHAAYLQAGAELMASGIMCSIADNATTRELEAHRLLAGLRRAVVKGYGVLLQTLATLGLPEEEAGAVFALSPLDTLKMGASPHHPELDLLLRRPWVALALADASGRVDVDENGTSIWAEPETARHVLKLPGLLEMIDQAFDELTEVFLAHCYFPVALADGILASELTDAPDVGELADKLDLQPS